MPKHRHNSAKQNSAKAHNKQQRDVVEHNHVEVDENRDPQQQQQQYPHRQQNGLHDSVNCCLPTGCDMIDDVINLNDPEDAIKVICNNENCKRSQFMHRNCFDTWEQSVLAYLRSCGRARSWSEKQRLQNLWTKKGYDLAYKACDCSCNRGHLRKDLDYIPKMSKSEKAKKKNKKKNDKPVPVMTNKQQSHPQAVNNGHNTSTNSTTIGNNRPSQQQQREQVISGPQGYQRVRQLSLTSTGSSPPNSVGSPAAMTPPSTPCTPISSAKKSKFDFFNDSQAVSGNIFLKRVDLTAFNVLPRHKLNPYHIKMEDDGPHGNDDTRCFVLSNLSTYKATSVQCILCKKQMPVFDKYPLIDGTFFLSPINYIPDSAFPVLSDGRLQYLQSVCMHCLEGGISCYCLGCRRRWDGSTLLLGTMYSYDIFAATPCCQKRLTCKNCFGLILGPLGGYQYYSDYSRPIQCPTCKVEDYHFVKPINDAFALRHHMAPICK